MTSPNDLAVYQRIAQNLREFGYGDVSRNMVAEVHEAMTAGAELPHGVVGMFAKRQLDEALGDDSGA